MDFAEYVQCCRDRKRRKEFERLERKRKRNREYMRKKRLEERRRLLTEVFSNDTDK